MTVATHGGDISRPVASVSVGALAWTVLAVAFLALRVAITWQAPVGGSELAHLSGAWNASLGVDDDRFVPTFFLALVSWLFEFTSSETAPRVLAFLATATIPAALYLLRGLLGQAGALFALLVLAFDPVAAWLGVAATASAFDLALAVWLLVLLIRDDVPSWAGGPAAFLVASAGPIPLTLAFAAGILALATRRYPTLRELAPIAAGAAFAILLASCGFGRGWQGFTIPPFALLTAVLEEDWSTATAADLTVLYSWPIIAAGSVAAIQQLAAMRGLPRSFRTSEGVSFLLLAWFAVGLLAFLAGLPAHAEVPVAAVTLPAAILAGPMLARALTTLVSVRNPLAWLTLVLAMFTLVLIAAILSDWARLERVGPANETARVLVYSGALLVLLAGIAWFREPLSLLAVPLVIVGAIPLVTGTIAVGTSASSEPLPSPLSGGNERALRAVALETVAEQGGVIAVYVDFADDLTWALRDSGDVVVTTQVPPDASFVIWPVDRPAPDGFTQAMGTWSLVEEVTPPVTSRLRLAHWMVERHMIGPMPVPVAAYVRTAP